MAYTDFDDFLAQLASPHEQKIDLRNALTTVAGRLYSGWLASGSTLGAGSTPSTAVVPTRTDAGAIGQADAITDLRLGQTQMNRTAAGLWILCDRLSHQGGLSGTDTAAQTTNLPTAALTRYTTGEGVLAALEIYTAVGSTGTTVSVSYTNQSGSTGRTSPLTTFGGTGFNAASRFIVLPLQQGDSGVRAVASVDLVASTATAGNFGVTLFKPLAFLPIPFSSNDTFFFDAIRNLGGQLPKIEAGACLFWLFLPQGTSGGQTLSTLTFTDTLAV